MNLRRASTFLLLLVAGYLVAAVTIGLLVRFVAGEELSPVQEVVVGISVHVLALIAGLSFARSQMRRQGW